MERLAIRPLAGAPAVNAVIITIGVSILLRGGAMLAFGKDTLALPAFSGVKPILAMGIGQDAARFVLHFPST